MTLKRILRTQYIGSIVVGMLCFQGLTVAVTMAAGIISRVFMPARHSVLEPPPPFNWDWLALQLVTIALYFGIAVFIYRWAALGTDIPFAPVETEPEHDGGDSIEPA